MKPNWTEERIAFLTDKWKEDWSAAQIAGPLHLTRNAVMGKLNRMGLVGRKPVAKAKGPQQQFAAKPVPLALVSKNGISLYDLTSTTCRWPVGHPVHFCGVLCDAEKPYCEQHARIARRG